MSKYKKHIAELTTRLYRNDVTQRVSWLDSDNQYTLKMLVKDARKLRRFFEYQCNGCVTDKHQYETWEQYDKRRAIDLEKVEVQEDRARARIEKRCKELGIPYYIQCDPRGASLYLGVTYDDETEYTKGVALY